MTYERFTDRSAPARSETSPREEDADSAHPTDPLLKECPAAKILTVSVSALQAWRRKEGTGPRFLKIGGSVRYRRSDLLRFLAECECAGIADSTQRGGS